MASILPGQKKVLDTTEDDEVAKAPSTGLQASGGGAGEARYTTGAAGPTTKTTKPSPIKGSGYTNVQKIMAASGAGGGPTRLASAVAGGVSGTTAKAAKDFESSQKEYRAGAEKTSADVLGRLKTGSDIITAAGSGTSPTNISDWGTATSGTAEAQKFEMSPEGRRRAAESSALAQLAGQAGGRSAILQRYVRAPQYNLGQQAMDALLLGKGGSGAIRGALRKGAKLEADIGRQEAVAKEQARQLQGQAAGVSEQLKSQLGGEVEKFKTTLDTSKEQKINETVDAYSRLLSVLSSPAFENIRPSGSSLTYRSGGSTGAPRTYSPVISRKDLATLGLTENDISKIGTLVDPISYFSMTPEELKNAMTSVAASQFATNSQQATAAALGKLAGQENAGIIDLGKYYTSDPLLQFNVDQYLSQVSLKKEEEMAPLRETQKNIMAELPKINAIFSNGLRANSALDYYLNSELRGLSFDALVQKIYADMPDKSDYVSVNGKKYTTEAGATIIANKLKQVFDIENRLSEISNNNYTQRQFTFID